MTTSTTTPRLNYTADGSTAAFTFNFEIADSSSIAVYVGSTLKTLTSEYTVSFDSGTSGTGTVTFTSAPSSGTVTLIRDTNLARTTDFENSGAFLASTVNTEFDRLSQAVIDATDKIEQRAILLAEPNTETATLTLPDAATRANKQLSFDSSGDIQVTSAGTGTVSNIATGTGLTGGPITTTGTIAIDSTVATLTGSQTLTNKTLTAPVISTISNSGTLTLPTLTDTLVGRTTVDTLSNKTINSAANTITITESNISDLGAYITATSTDTLQNKTIDTASNTITVNEADIADLQSYITASSTATLTNKTFDANGTGNSISNIETADFASAAFKDEDNMASDSATAVASQQSIKAYVDAEDANIASDSLTFTNKSGAISQWSNDTGYLVNTVEDTTPQLGGDLDLNSNNITGTGAINITGDITGTNIRATGNLTVDGTTTTLNTTNLSVEDAFIELNRNNSSTATGTDAGIFIRNGYTGAGTDYNPAFYWDHGDQKFRFMVTDVDPNTTVDLNDGSYTLANVSMGSLSSGPITASASTFYGLTLRNNSGQDALEINQNNITGLRSNDDINITTAGTGTVNISSLTLPTGSTVTSILDEDTFSSNSNTALATQQSIKSYVDGQGFLTSVGGTISEGNSSVVVADSATGTVTVTLDGGTVAQFTDANGLTMSKNIAMGGNTITGLSTATPSADSDVANKKYVDDSLVGLSTASSVDTFTNKTFDANGTGNSISNIEVADLAGSAVITAAETIAANDNDTTLPTSAAVKDYADSVAGINNVVEDTTPQLGGNLDLNSNNITGTGDVSITGTIANEGISISGNNITSTRSNDDVDIKASGTGRTVIEDVFYFASDYTFNSTAGSYIQMSGNGEIVLNPYAAGNVTIGGSSGGVEETIQTNNNPLWLRAGKSDSGSAIIKINGSTTTTGTEGYMYLRAGNDGEASPAHGRVEIQGTDTNTVYLQNETGKEFHITTRDSNKDLKLLAHGTGDVHVGNFRFDADQTVGAGQDNYVLTYDNSTGKISLEAGTSSFTATSTDTLTNKTFDVEGTGNSISNIDVADFKAAAVVTAAEGIGSNNNDTTLPTSAAVKAYADSVGGGGTITALNNQTANRLTTIGSTTTELDGEANLTFDGTTLTLTGSAALDGVTIADNEITTNRSNDTLLLTANGTGRVEVVESLADSTLWSAYNGTHTRIKGFAASLEDLSVDADTVGREYGHAFNLGNKLTNGSSSNSNWRPRALLSTSTVDMDGNDYTQTGMSRGPMGGQFAAVALNSNGSTASTLANMRGFNTNAGIADYTSPSQDITVNNAFGNHGQIFIEGNGTNDKTITNGYNFYADSYVDESGSGTSSITNMYGFYFGTGAGTNKYAFYDATNSLSVFGDIQTQAVSITDNLITTNRSDDNLNISANGTGKISMGSDDFYGSNPLYTDYYGQTDFAKIAGMRYDQTVDANTAARAYGLAVNLNTTVTGSSSTNSDFRQRGINGAITVDMAGYDYTRSGLTRGPTGSVYATNITNSSSTASTINAITGASNWASAYASGGTYAAGDLTINNAVANMGTIELYSGGGAGDFTITNGYAFRSEAFIDGSNDTVTNMYGFYHGASSSQTGTITNNYAFYSASDTAKSRVGSLERYREEINALTSSTGITVDCDLAPVHTVTLAHNSTFTISNLGTGQTVTIIITQDGTGSRTGAFTGVKFPGGAPTLSTGAADIDVVTIFNDGTNTLGNIAQDYA